MTNFALSVFFAYAREDDEIRDKLSKHLSPLKRNNYITEWHDGEILPGQEWNETIKNKLDAADIILILVSSDFISSKYSYNIEFTRALERHKSNVAVVIPIIVRPCAWKETPISKIQVLPKNGYPIIGTDKWQSEDEAFTNVTNGVNKIVKTLLKERGLLEDDETNNEFERTQSIENFLSQMGKYDRTMFEVQEENKELKRLIPQREKEIQKLKEKIIGIRNKIRNKNNEIILLNQKNKNLEIKITEMEELMRHNNEENLKTKEEVMDVISKLNIAFGREEQFAYDMLRERSRIIELEKNLQRDKSKLERIRNNKSKFSFFSSEEERTIIDMIGKKTEKIVKLKIGFANIFLYDDNKINDGS